VKNSSTRIYQADAFTSEPFHGNPAAVCILNGPREDAWMQSVAMEMNLSETAFLTPRSPNRFDIRWMTPTVEVDLCGHATLASAHVLFEQGFADSHKPISFYSRSGPLSASLEEGSIELNFPAKQEHELVEPPGELLLSIPAEIAYIGKNDFDYLLELRDESTVRSIVPNFALMKKVGARGVVITSLADKGKDYDFVSRGFFPGSGIDEDPVTGSAHCMLGPYWMPRLRKTQLTGYQASARGGYVRLRTDGDRVRLYGNAVTIFKGELLV
jgi:PhzF family phenazine biosynthesis protein